MSSWQKIAVVFSLLSVGTVPAMATEIACSSDGGFNRCPLPHADTMNVKLQQKLEGNCTKGKTWGTDSDGVWVDKGCSAVFAYTGGGKKSGSGGGGKCPSDIKGNECEYYTDGYKAGAEDGKAGQSMAYERHSDAYDSRFEPYYARGYEAGWKANR